MTSISKDSITSSLFCLKILILYQKKQKIRLEELFLNNILIILAPTSKNTLPPPRNNI